MKTRHATRQITRQSPCEGSLLAHPTILKIETSRSRLTSEELAVDRATGQEVWRSELTGSDFVNVVIDDGQLYASTKGELFCLDPATGEVRWQNELKGLGRGLVAIASSGGSGIAVMGEKRRRDEAAAAASTAASSTAFVK